MFYHYYKFVPVDRPEIWVMAAPTKSLTDRQLAGHPYCHRIPVKDAKDLLRPSFLPKWQRFLNSPKERNPIRNYGCYLASRDRRVQHGRWLDANRRRQQPIVIGETRIRFHDFPPVRIT